MLKKRIPYFILVFSLSLSSMSWADENCIYNDDVISEQTFSDNESVTLYQLFSKKNEVKGVLSNGNLFSIKHWSCNHYGKHSFMVIGPEMQSIPDKLNSQVMYLGEISLSGEELSLLAKKIKNKPIKLSDLPIKLNISSDEFSEFYIQVGVAGEAIYMEIKLYKD